MCDVAKQSGLVWNSCRRAYSDLLLRLIKATCLEEPRVSQGVTTIESPALPYRCFIAFTPHLHTSCFCTAQPWTVRGCSRMKDMCFRFFTTVSV